jgi:hypothetical protein
MNALDGSGCDHRVAKYGLEVSSLSEVRIGLRKRNFRHVELYYERRKKISIFMMAPMPSGRVSRVDAIILSRNT